MDIVVHTGNENIRKIEDIIDIQKANGSFNCRQVVFNLPSDTESAVSTNVAKSLDSGLCKTKAIHENKKKFHKLRPKRKKNLMPDVVSWPSDSDITVLRMKFFLSGKSSKLKETVDDLIIPGDGLHRRDSSSMVNLATLMRQTQSQSKQSFVNEEYLLPLTSWEGERELDPSEKIRKAEQTQTMVYLTHFKDTEEFNSYDAMCSYKRKKYSSKNSFSDYSRIGAGSKLARFLRLYFCPCCTCLYRLEKVNDDPSYFTKRNFSSLLKEI